MAVRRKVIPPNGHMWEPEMYTAGSLGCERWKNLRLSNEASALDSTRLILRRKNCARLGSRSKSKTSRSRYLPCYWSVRGRLLRARKSRSDCGRETHL